MLHARDTMRVQPAGPTMACCDICLDDKPRFRMMQGSFCGGRCSSEGEGEGDGARSCRGSSVCKTCARKSIEVQLTAHGAMHAGRVPPTLRCPICPGRRLLPLERLKELLSLRRLTQMELGAKSALRFFCGRCHAQREMLVPHDPSRLAKQLPQYEGVAGNPHKAFSACRVKDNWHGCEIGWNHDQMTCDIRARGLP